MEKVYKISQDFKYFGKISFVNFQQGAQHLPFTEQDDVSYKMSTDELLDLPKVIPFAADYKVISKTDFPHNSLLLNIFSKKMLETLLTVASFNHRTVPVTMYDHLELEVYHIEQGARLKDLKEHNHDYVALQLMEYTDVFNFEKSIYEKSDIFEGMIKSIDKLVFKQPENGFPPIFKTEEETMYLYISEQAKIALEQAGINGCVFEEVEVSL